ncbi:MAG: hypothetical protein WCE63_18220 [Acidobacteriaceae bacterium]
MAAHAAQEGGPPPPNVEQPGARPGLSPLPPLPHIDPDQRDAQRTITGPYRLTYTLTEMDGSRRVGSQSYAIVLDADALHSHLKLDSLVPVRYGSSTAYERVHASVIIDATLRQRANGLELITNIMQTAFAKETDKEQTAGATPPITRDFVFTTTTLLTENKLVTIGQLDIPGTPRRLQVEVELTKIP